MMLSPQIWEYPNRRTAIIERRSRYVTLPWQQNFWMTTNRKSTSKVISHCFKLHRSSISFNLSNVGEIFWIESERTVSEFRKRKETILCCVHLGRKEAREIRKFHVAVVQRWLSNVQKSVMHVQSCCFTNIHLLLFAVLVSVAVVVVSAPFCCDPKNLLPW